MQVFNLPREKFMTDADVGDKPLVSRNASETESQTTMHTLPAVEDTQDRSKSPDPAKSASSDSHVKPKLTLQTDSSEIQLDTSPTQSSSGSASPGLDYASAAAAGKDRLQSLPENPGQDSYTAPPVSGTLV